MSTSLAHQETEAQDLDEAICLGWRFVERGEDLLVRANDVAQDVKQRVENLELQDPLPSQPG